MHIHVSKSNHSGKKKDKKKTKNIPIDSDKSGL